MRESEGICEQDTGTKRFGGPWSLDRQRSFDSVMWSYSQNDQQHINILSQNRQWLWRHHLSVTVHIQLKVIFFQPTLQKYPSELCFLLSPTSLVHSTAAESSENVCGWHGLKLYLKSGVCEVKEKAESTVLLWSSCTTHHNVRQTLFYVCTGNTINSFSSLLSWMSADTQKLNHQILKIHSCKQQFLILIN